MPDPSSLAALPITTADISAGLRRLGLQSGDGVMVHSSLKSIGQVAGGPLAVIQALMEVLTPAGSLLMPSFNHDTAFRPGAPGYYHPQETPTINGAIPDLFWRLPGVYRSLDPTHPIAAWGKNAKRYTQYHHRTLTMGPNSPLGLLWQDGGYGLLVGVDYHANTFHHVVETATGAPCLGLRSEAYPVHLPDGRSVSGRTWGWRQEECPITDQLRYQPLMADRGLHQQTMIGAALVTLFRLQDCYSLVSELLENGLGPFPPCKRCPYRPRTVPHTVPSDWDSANQCLLPDSQAWLY